MVDERSNRVPAVYAEMKKGVAAHTEADLIAAGAPAPGIDEDGRLTSELCPLPALDEAQEVIWARCTDSKMGPSMLRAMRLLLAGYTFEESAMMVGYKRSQAVVRTATRLGLAGESKRLMALQRANTQLALEKLTEGIESQEASWRDIAVIAGIGMDKIDKHEQRMANAAQTHTLAGLIGQLVEALHGTSLELKVSPAPVIDVTPEK